MILFIIDIKNLVLFSKVKIKKTHCNIVSVEVGGLNEKGTYSVFEGEKTKSKTDIQVYLSDGSKYNVSIKKSLSGQVYLIGIMRFIEGFEKQFKVSIPRKVKNAISFFWGCNEETRKVIEECGTHKKYEFRKNRLVAESLKIYDEFLYDILLEWFNANIEKIAEFCFSKGLATNKDDWANIIWYRNEINENNINEIFYLPDLFSKISSIKKPLVKYGNRSGGTTIQLPFGFVQWHSPTRKIPGEIQFHHNYEKIKLIFKKDNDE